MYKRQLTLWQAAVCCVLFFLTSLCFETGPIPRRPLDLTFYGATAFIILVATVFSFVVWVYLFEHNNPSQVTSFCFITPVASVISGWLLLGEPISRDIVLGTALVGVGIFIANFQFQPRRANSAPGIPIE